jgi:branched-chain amino acid transport system substrate-binding protein
VQTRTRWALRCAATAAVGGLLAVGSLAGTSSAASPLGKPHKAKGKPIVLAMIDDIGGSLSAPEAVQGAQAAVDYVNNYLDGVNGRPFKLYTCSNTTNTPASSATCANELLTHHPQIVLGAIDTGAPGAFPVWNSAHLPYVGGLTFTGVESNASNAVIFSSLNGADNAAPIVYAHKVLHVNSVSIIEADDTQGIATGGLVKNVAERIGMSATTVALSDTASTSQFAAAAAQAEASNPGLIYVESPAECPQAVLAVNQTGYKGHMAAIGICDSPPAIQTMGSASNGLIMVSPYIGLDQAKTKQWGGEIATTLAAVQKYEGNHVALDSAVFGDFGSVMNLQATLKKLHGKYTEKSVIGAFEKGKNHPNWMAHPYTCNRKQVATQTAACNPYEWISHIENGKTITLDRHWVNGAAEIRAGDGS